MDFLTTQTGYEFVYRKGVLNTGEKGDFGIERSNGRAGFGLLCSNPGDTIMK